MTTEEQRRAEPSDEDQTDDHPLSPDHLDTERVRALRRRLEALLGIPATEGNALTVLRNGDEIFPAMLDAIRAARRTVDLLTFIYWQGDIAREFAAALAERARAGRRVRLLIDAVGARSIDRELVEDMMAAGVAVEWYRKPWLVSPFKQNHRTHRKVLLVDDVVAFTGGVGIAEEWCGDARDETQWRDTHLRVEGPAVDGLIAAFVQNWAETGRPLSDDHDTFPDHGTPGHSVVQVVRGSATVSWNDISTVFRVLLNSARQRVRLSTAYFTPDETVRDLLGTTVARGVQVDLLLPGPHDDKRVSQLASERTYADLAEAGVRLWNFQPSMLHAKIMTVDGLAALVGSANLNNRSLHHDEEVVLTVLDPVVARLLEGHFDIDLQRSERIHPARWSDRPLHQRVEEDVVGLIRHWL